MSFKPLLRRAIQLERHVQGPRVYVAGRHIHEFQLEFPILTVPGAIVPAGVPLLSVWTVVTALLRAYLVVKDWPDVSRPPATRRPGAGACTGCPRPPSSLGRSRSPS
jgi:hypothetical protein